MSDKDTPKNRVVNDPEPSTAPSWSEDSTLSTQASLNGADGTIDDETGLEEIPLDELAVEIDHKANQSPVGSRSTMECTDDSQGWEDINLEELQSVSEIKPKAHVLSRDEQLVLLCQAIRNRDIEAAELRRRLHDFDRARELRAAIYAPVYYGIFGVYSYLEDLRADLEWASDAAWRRLYQQPYVSWYDFDQRYHQSTFQSPNKAYFCFIIMLVSTATLIISLALHSWRLAPYSVNPLLGPSPEVLLRMGAVERTALIVDEEWYRLLSAMALHAGIVHYLINMMAIWFIGSAVERVHGTLKAAFIFILAGIGGNVASALFALPNSLSVGASGGIFGWLGLCLADVVVNWELFTLREKKDALFPSKWVWCWLAVDIVLNAILGLTPLIDNFAHLGGLFYGFCCGLPLLDRIGGDGFFGNRPWRWRCVSFRVMGLLVATSVLTATAVLLAVDESQVSSICPGCRYMTCAPFPFWRRDRWWYCDGCDSVEASLHSNGTLVMHCPLGSTEAIVVDDDDAIMAETLIGYCRQYC